MIFMLGRPRSFDRKEALSKATLVFWRYGYDATSIAMLTDAMGIRAPSLYAAFGDKRKLFEEALGYYAETDGAFILRTFREETDARAAVERLLREAAVMFSDRSHPPGCLVITSATNCSPQSVEVENHLRSYRALTVRALEETMSNAKAKGRLPASVDVRALALFYSSVLQGMSAQARDGASRKELDAIVATALSAWPRRPT
jgi:AcrR family transcriptional regulator